MPLQIAGLATAVPRHRFSTDDTTTIAESFSLGDDRQRRMLPVLARRTMVDTRHSVILDTPEGTLRDRQTFYPQVVETPEGRAVDPPTTADRMRAYAVASAELALPAARDALQESGVAPERVTHLVTVSCTGFASPGTDIALIRELGLPANVQRTNVGFMGCHAALNGLRVARAIAEADPAACVLVSATELCSLHFQYTEEVEQLVANSLFADGSAAIVGFGSESDLAKEGGSRGGLVVRDNAAEILPATEDLMTWQIGDEGFLMTLSPELPGRIQATIRPMLEGWLGKHGIASGDVTAWAVHPGGPRILGAFAEAMHLEEGDLRHSYGVLKEYGNMSSPTVLFVLDRWRREFAERNTSGPVVALGFGPGLAIEAMLLEAGPSAAV